MEHRNGPKDSRRAMTITKKAPAAPSWSMDCTIPRHELMGVVAYVSSMPMKDDTTSYTRKNTHMTHVTTGANAVNFRCMYMRNMYAERPLKQSASMAKMIGMNTAMGRSSFRPRMIQIPITLVMKSKMHKPRDAAKPVHPMNLVNCPITIFSFSPGKGGTGSGAFVASG